MGFPEQVPVNEGYVDIGDVRLWHWDTGGEGEAVVLCHPASQSCRVWGYQQPVLAESGYRVIGYSRRGYYRSEIGPDGQRGTTVGDLAALLDKLGIEKAHVIGAAAGGITALAFAAAHPNRTLSTILAGTIFSVSEDSWRECFARLGLSAVRSAVSTEFLELGPSYRFRDPEGTAKFAALEKIAKPNGRFDQPSGVEVTWAVLKGLSVPILLLTGEADLYAPPPLQNMIAAYLPNCERATLREVGHAAYWEAPDEFNALVMEFLARH